MDEIKPTKTLFSIPDFITKNLHVGFQKSEEGIVLILTLPWLGLSLTFGFEELKSMIQALFTELNDDEIWSIFEDILEDLVVARHSGEFDDYS